MAANDKQKTVLVDIDANLKATIDAALLSGFVILMVVNLQPAQDKLLIIYATPPEP